MSIPRREFLKRSALGMGSVLAGLSSLGAATSDPGFFDPFEPVALGKSGLKFTRFCLGTGVHGGNRQSDMTRMGKEKCEALIQGAHERGIGLFDLADLYGTHPFLLPALRGLPRDRYGIVSKIWFRRGASRTRKGPMRTSSCNGSLRKSGPITWTWCCCIAWNHQPGRQLRKQMDLLENLKQKGTIRAHGVSCHSIEALEAAAAEPWVDSVHTRINPYGMSMDGPVDKVVPALKKLHAAGKGVVGMKIIGEGRLRNDPEKRDASARFVLGLGCIDVLNIGFEKVEEIDDFAARVRKVPRNA